MARDLAHQNPGGQLAAAGASISAMRHHGPMASAILRLGPVAFDTTIRPVPFEPGNPVAIRQALELDARLPSSREMQAIRLRLADAHDGPPATGRELGQLLPLLFAMRGTVKPESIPQRIACLMEMLAIERAIIRITADVVALAIMLDLRSNKFAPEPSDFIAAIHKAREKISDIRAVFGDLTEARDSADDLLIAADLREVDEAGCEIPWDAPSKPLRGRR